MKRTKLRKFKVGALFLLMGLFFVLLTGCDTLLPGSTAKNENVDLALEQTQINFAAGDTKTSVTKSFQLPVTVQGVSVQWISSDEDVISIVAGKATVTRQNEDVTVYLTAKIGSKGYYLYKTFEVIVKADDDVAPEEVRYQVRFFVDGILYGEVQMVLDGNQALPPIDPYKEDHRFMGWFLDEGFTREFDKAAPITKDTDLYGKFEAGGYQVRFFVDGILYGPVQYIKYGDSAIVPDDPVVDGKYFISWDRNSFIIFKNTDVHAVLTPIPTYVVRFIDHDDTVLKEQQVFEKTAATAPNNPTRTGYTFTGWDQEFNNVTNDIDINAVYQINEYTATFKVEGEEDQVSTFAYNAAVTAPQMAAKAGHSFAWTDEIPATMPAENIVIRGSYQVNEYTITYNLNEGTNHADNPTKYNVLTPTITLKPASKAGYNFDGWFNQSNTKVTEITLGSTGNITLTAKFSLIVYNVTVTGDGVTTNPEVLTDLLPNSNVVFTFDKAGYILDTVEVDDVAVDVTGNTYTLKVTNNHNVVVTWIQLINVTFDLNEGELVGLTSPVVVPSGTKVANPGNPTKEGFNFIEWQLNGNKYDFDSVVTEPITLKAYYEEIPPEMVNVTFNLNEGELVGLTSPVEVEKGTKVANPGNPTKEGHIFIEWQLNGETYDFNTLVTEAISLDAYYIVPIEGLHTVSVKYVGDLINTDIPDGNINSYLTITQTTGNSPVNVSFDGSGATTKTLFNNSNSQIRLYAGGKLNVSVPGAVITKIEWTSTRNNGIKINDGAVINTQNGSEVFQDGVDAVTILVDGAQFRMDELVVTYRVGEPPEMVNVTFNLNEGELVGLTSPVEVEKGTKVDNPGNPTKEGHDFVEWRLNGVKYNFDELVTEAISLDAYYTVKSYTVTYQVTGLDDEVDTYDFGAPIVVRNNLVKAGYTFSWDTTNLPANMPAENLVVKGEFTAIPLAITASGSKSTALKLTFNQDVTFAADIVNKKEFINALFTHNVDWTVVDLDKITIAYDNVNFELTFTFADNVITGNTLEHIDYINGNGDGIFRRHFELKNASIISAAAHALTSESVVETYRLKLWVSFDDLNNKANYTEDVKALVYNVADWTADKENDPVCKYEVVFKVNGSPIGNPVEVIHNESVEKPEDPIVPEYIFKGWEVGGLPYDFTNKVTSNLEITAKMKHQVATVTDEASLKAAIEDVEIIRIEFANDINVSLANKKLEVKSNVTIDGKGFALIQEVVTTWQSAYAFHAYKVTGVVIKNLTIKNGDAGILVNGSEVTVTNVTLSNNRAGGIEVSQGEGVTTVPLLTVSGTFEFDYTNVPPIWIDGKTTNGGWVVQDQGLIEATYTPNDETKQLFFVEATNPGVMTVTFDYDGYTPAKVVYGSRVLRPAADPVQIGFDFVEWQKDGATYDFDQLVTAPITLTPLFIADLVITASGSTTNVLTLEFSEDVYFTDGTNPIDISDIATNNVTKRTLLENIFAFEATVNFDLLDFDKITIAYDNTLFKLSITFADGVMSSAVFQAADYGNGNGDGILRFKFELVNANVKTVSHDATSESVIADYRLKLYVPWDEVNKKADYTSPVSSKVYNKADYLVDKENDPTFYHNVTFMANGEQYGAVLEVERRKKATAPQTNPTKTEHKFIEWRLSGETSAYDFNSDVLEDIVLVAHFEINQYVITWKDGNNEVIKTESVAYGATPAYEGATPTKTATPTYTYTFNNSWSPAIVAVTGDAVYTAQFTENLRSYKLTLPESGVVADYEDLNNVPVGTTVTLTINIPEGQQIVSVLIDGEDLGVLVDNNYAFDMPAKHATVVVTFEEIVLVKYTPTLDGTGVTTNPASLTDLEENSNLVITFTKDLGLLKTFTVDNISQVDNINTEAKTFTLKITANHAIKVEWYPSISEVRELTKGTTTLFVGIVTEVAGNSVTVQDNTAGISVFGATTKPADLAAGDKVKVSGKLDEYKGLIQIGSGGTIERLSAGNALPETTTLTTLANAANYMSQLVSINDLEFVRKEASNQNIVVKLGDNEMVLRAPDTSGAIFDLLNTIDHGVVVSVNNSVLNWFNGPQINVNNSEQITITVLSDTEKVNKVDAYLKAEYDNKSYENGTDVLLPKTDPFFGVTITWTYNPEAAVVADKWAQVGEVEATGTFAIGTSNGSSVINITVVVPDPVVEYTLTDARTELTGTNYASFTVTEENGTWSGSANSSGGKIGTRKDSGDQVTFTANSGYYIDAVKISVHSGAAGARTVKIGDITIASGITSSNPVVTDKITLEGELTKITLMPSGALQYEFVTVYVKQFAVNLAREDINQITITPTEYDVATDLTLPTEGTVHSSVITWTSSHPAIIATDGTMVLPDDTTLVTLTAKATKGLDVYEKEFKINVIGIGSKILEELNALTAIGPNITENLTLPGQTATSGYTITWSSNNAAIVIDGTAGTVTRAELDVPVVLTATATNAGVTRYREFEVTVVGIGTELESELAALSALPIQAISNLTLEATTANNYVITWSSNKAAITISGTTGVVTRPTDADVLVVVTAKISSGLIERTREFEVLVLKEGAVLEEYTITMIIGTASGEGENYETYLTGPNSVSYTTVTDVADALGVWSGLANYQAKGFGQKSGNYLTYTAPSGYYIYSIQIEGNLNSTKSKTISFGDQIILSGSVNTLLVGDTIVLTGNITSGTFSTNTGTSYISKIVIVCKPLNP